MKAFVLAAVSILLPAAAFAQVVDPQSATGAIPGAASPGVSGVAPGGTTGSLTNSGQLDFGNGAPGRSAGGASGLGGAVSGPASNAGQLELGRTPSGGMPSTGAGIGTGAAGVPGTDDVYTRPIYGR